MAGFWVIAEGFQNCPECGKAIVYLQSQKKQGQQDVVVQQPFLAFPANVTDRPLPSEVPDPYRSDFSESAAVLSMSPKASAALSRRNLQAVLRDKAATKSKDLYDQIEEIVVGGKLPSHIFEGLHAVRLIGNFAAHPTKSTSTGQIVDVEAGEAEWNLDVLESLFDFYFVQPEIVAKRKAALNQKLLEAGKLAIP